MQEPSTDDLIASLGASIGIPNLRCDSARACQLVFDQRWVVTLLDDPSRARLTLNCPLGAAGHTQTLGKSALCAMLQANFMGQGLSGCVLSIAQDERAYLQIALSLQGSTPQSLSNALEVLLNQAEIWAERLSRPEASSPTLSTPVHAAAPAHSLPPWSRLRV